MDNYYDIEEPKKGFTVGKLFKWMFIAVIVAIYAIIIVRCNLYSDDDFIQKVIVNDHTISAYATLDKSEHVAKEYGMNSAWVAVEEGRLVEFKKLYHLEESHQLQVGIKYNTDIAENMREDGLPFRFYLTDGDGNIYSDYFFESKQKAEYMYVRVCFNDIDLVIPDGTPDEAGNLPRKNYTLHIEKLGADGGYTELCNFRIYGGSKVNKDVSFSINK